MHQCPASHPSLPASCLLCSLSPGESTTRPLSLRGKLTSYRLCCRWSCLDHVAAAAAVQAAALVQDAESFPMALGEEKCFFFPSTALSFPDHRPRAQGAPQEMHQGWRESFSLAECEIWRTKPFPRPGLVPNHQAWPQRGEGNELLPVTALASRSCSHQKRKIPFFFFFLCRKSKGFYQTGSLTHRKVTPWRRVAKASYCSFYQLFLHGKKKNN